MSQKKIVKQKIDLIEIQYFCDICNQSIKYINDRKPTKCSICNKDLCVDCIKRDYVTLSSSPYDDYGDKLMTPYCPEHGKQIVKLCKEYDLIKTEFDEKVHKIVTALEVERESLYQEFKNAK